jgi:uncharacterized membrane protein YgdD (TMEM256/DUF423 family)
MHRTYLSVAALLGGIAVALGAFGAHGLKKIVPPETVSTFQTGVQYQMYHSLALLAAGIVFEKFPGKWLKWSGACFILGIGLFSGSLYALTALKVTGKVGLDGIGAITPIGGLFFIAGWLFLLIAFLQKKPL